MIGVGDWAVDGREGCGVGGGDGEWKDICVSAANHDTHPQ